MRPYTSNEFDANLNLLEAFKKGFRHAFWKRHDRSDGLR